MLPQTNRSDSMTMYQLISDDFYSAQYETYKSTSTPVTQILNNTFDKLHYGLSMNDHDTFFSL